MAILTYFSANGGGLELNGVRHNFDKSGYLELTEQADQDAMQYFLDNAPHITLVLEPIPQSDPPSDCGIPNPATTVTNSQSAAQQHLSHNTQKPKA